MHGAPVNDALPSVLETYRRLRPGVEGKRLGRDIVLPCVSPTHVELAKAFARARRVRGVVAIAKLDRLARDVHFIAGLVKTGQAFACVDAPDDDAFMLHVRASVAEDEARKISKRTKDALAAAKARGKKLGNPQNLTDEGRERGSRTGAATMKARAKENREALRDAVLDGRQRGLSLRAIAKEVGCGTMTVSRILADTEIDE